MSSEQGKRSYSEYSDEYVGALVESLHLVVAERDSLREALQQVDDEAEVAEGVTVGRTACEVYYISEDCLARVKDALAVGRLPG